MTIRYTATLNNKHLSLTALYPDGGQEVIAILPVTELGALINRNNRLMHLSFSTPFREITETLLVDTVDTERPGHHIGRMLSAIDSCLSAAYSELPARKTSFMRGLIYGAGLVLALLTAVTAGYILLKPDSDSPLRVPVTESVTETAPLHIDKEIVRSVAPSETKNEIVHPAPQEMQETSATPAITADKNTLVAEARRNLATVLKRNADRGMFTINLSTGHERTLYAFLDPACINCRLLEPALKQLAREFSVVIYPVSVIGGEA
ncbi:DsbC family protein, partial [Escherichia coli]|nr:DsbC family protein [Escherichia coli]